MRQDRYFSFCDGESSRVSPNFRVPPGSLKSSLALGKKVYKYAAWTPLKLFWRSMPYQFQIDTLKPSNYKWSD